MRTAAFEDRNRPPPKIRIKRFSPSDDVKVQAFEAIGEAVQEFLHSSLDLHEPTIEMKAWLVETLSQGKFAAVGVRTKPAGEVELRSIPVQLFKGRPKIKWLEGVVENFGQRYEAVEISKTTQSVKSIPKSKRKAGRPRKSDKILQVATELRGSNRFRGRLKKEIVALVQKECRRRYPDDFPKESQPAQTSVRKVLLELKVKHH